MALTGLMSKIGFIKKIKEEAESCAVGGEVEIQDGKIIGNPYLQFDTFKSLLNDRALDSAYTKVSCVGSSIDLIANNIQMIEPVFWNDEDREAMEYPSDKELKKLRRLFEKPNSVDNRKSFLSKCVKNYELHGVIYFVCVLSGKEIISIKVIDNSSVSMFLDAENSRIDRFNISNNGAYSGNYLFNGSYYVNEDNASFVLAPYINSSPECQYMPASPLLGTGIEVLMYWYGCFHNKSLLENGARPSMIVLIKSLLNPKHREQLRQEIKIRHAGAGNAGSAIIIDGAAEKEIKQLSQNNKDMEFNTMLQAAEDAIYKRLGTNWILGKNVQSKDFQKGMEVLYDMAVCPLFQGIYNHLFDVHKYYNSKHRNLKIIFLEQDIPALRPRFIERMAKIPALAIFTIGERRKMFNYKPLGDERDDELVAQTVSVYQQGMSSDKQNVTSFGGDANEDKDSQDNTREEQ